MTDITPAFTNNISQDTDFHVFERKSTTDETRIIATDMETKESLKNFQTLICNSL